jgi:predicted DsbA family dithiol-disulfide isomerase
MQDQTLTPAAAHNRSGAAETKFCDDHLNLVRQHIAEGEARIARQAILIARFREHGLDTTEAETLVTVFRDSLALMREHQRHVQAENEKAS